VLEVPEEHMVNVYDNVLPKCMGKIPIYPIAIDGTSLETGPFCMSIDSTVYKHWGQPVKEAEWRKQVKNSR
jgi:hypothetical protein